MEKFVTGLFFAIFVVAIWFAVMGGMWWLWCWVLPQVYATGPHNILAPGFWLFAACWTLVSLAGRALFGRSKE